MKKRNGKNTLWAEEEKLPFLEKVSYGLGDFSCNMALSVLGNFSNYFYTVVVGISAGTVGLILFVARIADAAISLFIGHFVDKTKSKYGKARPWVLYLAVPFGISFFLISTVPNISEAGKSVYVLATYTLLTAVIYSALNIPYSAMNALMTRDSYQRSSLNIYRTFLAIVGNVLVCIITLPIVERLGNTQNAWILVIGIYSVVAVVLLLLCFQGTRERVKSTPDAAATKKKQTFVREVFSVLRNKYLVLLLVINLIMNFSNGIEEGNLYYFEYCLGNRNLFGGSIAIFIVPSLVGTSLISPWLLRRLQKRNTMLIGTAVSLLGQSLLLLSPGNIAVVYTTTFIRGLGSGIVASAFFPMCADVVEYGEYLSHTRREGMVYSLVSFGGKLGMGIGGILLGVMISLGGFLPGTTGQQPHSAIQAISFIYIWVPLIFLILQLILLWFYHLDGKYEEIIAILKKRHSAFQPVSPSCDEP